MEFSSRFFFLCASAPMVLVKLLRDTPLFAVGNLHAEEEEAALIKVPFYCILLHCLLCVLSSLPVSFWCATHGGFDNGHPRELKAKLTGFAHRLQAAHANTMEGLPIFLCSIYVAHGLQLEPVFLAKASAVAVVCRLLYLPLYYANIDMLRTYVFILWFSCCVLLMLAPLHPGIVAFFDPAAGASSPAGGRPGTSRNPSI